MEQNSIVVKNVTKKFDDFMLDHISFTVPTGRIVGFIGENGAGKSTTINLILDQLKLDTGEIRILGKQNHSYLHKENIGVVFDCRMWHSQCSDRTWPDGKLESGGGSFYKKRCA